MDSNLALSPPWWPSISPFSAKYHSLTSGIGPEMSENSGVQFMGARTKRRHREMATEDDGSGDAAWEQHFHPRRSDHARSDSRLPPRRDRDGFDYRRPVMLSPGDNAVIDLTNDPDSPPHRNVTSIFGPFTPPRPLRFPGDLMNHTSTMADRPAVIDLEAEVSPGSGDVQIVGSSTLRPRPIEPRYFDTNGIPIPMHFPPHTRRPRRSDGTWSGYRANGMSDLGLLHSAVLYPPIQPAPQPRSSYKGLSPAPEGFTRLLAEDDVPICPNCQDELGTGEGLKQQIHIAKPCGHVYCGECAGNRSISKSKKAASKTKPFSRCQVAGCNKPVSSPTAMYHLYL
ncbi:uncharacterized protein N7518_002166 [Penicillium psychrosexuale]|uniref:uncharacterized protein n=1 Tax=Penicillium psychrosexuale TaxID=1002107 RepID=UPI002545125D|nr:uncharacterized protein N7518_002166 [Penicillium psychrosexuale]KAJ5800098.1 hypothetical protein N7518_002166 [Penicillium psychrosexuale]